MASDEQNPRRGTSPWQSEIGLPSRVGGKKRVEPKVRPRGERPAIKIAICFISKEYGNNNPTCMRLNVFPSSR
jgi:hypothetical protein